MFDIKNIPGGRIYLNKKNSSGRQTLYVHVHIFEALLSIICKNISHGQEIKVLRHKNVVL